MPPPVILAGTIATKATIVGATDDFAELGRLKLREGRFVSALDATQYFCTVGSDLAEEFSQGSVVGETVRLEHALHRVAGVVGRVDGT